MGSEAKRHYLIEFAARNARSYLPTFNAFSAVWRLNALVDDAQMLLDLRTEAREKGIAFGHRQSTYEIVDYFVVGFATCLEWHARTRIVDLLNCVPSCIEPTDVRTIDKLALSQMSAEKVTLPEIVGASTKVSSIAEYTSAFDRVFDGLGLPDIRAERLLRNQIAEGPEWRGPTGVPPTVYDEVRELFETRNQLVHEIGLSVVAHFSLRYVWSPEEALRVGRIALSAMNAIEKIITDRAPADFPNRLDADGSPEDELARLASRIASVEDELTTKIRECEDDAFKSWEDTLRAHRTNVTSEMHFLEQANFLRPVRHLDFTRSAKLEYLRNRLRYLEALLVHLDETVGGK